MSIGNPPQISGDGDSTKEDQWEYLAKIIPGIASVVLAVTALIQSSPTAFYLALAAIALLLMIFSWPKFRSWREELRQKREQRRFIAENTEEFRNLVDSFDRYVTSSSHEITVPINKILNEMDREVERPDPIRLRGIYKNVSVLINQVAFTRKTFPLLLKTFLEIVEYHNKVFVHQPLEIIRKENPSVNDARKQEYDKYRHEYLNLMDRCEALKDAADEIFDYVHFHSEHPPRNLTPQGG